MPQRKGRPTARYALLHRLQRAKGVVRITEDDCRVLGIWQQRDMHPAARRGLRELFRRAEEANPEIIPLREALQRFNETGDVPPAAVTQIIRIFEVECATCGTWFLPQGRKRRKGLKVYCDKCRADAKRSADRERVRRKRARNE